MLKYFAIIFALFVVARPLVAQDARNPIRFAMPILVVAPDARSGGLGDIGVATSPTTDAQNWNAAKYTFIESKTGASLSYIPWLRNIGATNYINLLYLTGFYKFDDRNAIGAALRYFSVGELDFIGNNREWLQTTNPNEWAIDASYTRLLSDYISMSLTGRYIHSDLTGGYYDGHNVTSKPSGAFAVDVGLYWNKPIFMGDKTGSVAIGGAISNIGTKMSYAPNSDEIKSYFLPTMLRVGAEWLTHLNFYHDIAVNVELSKYLVPTTPVRDADNRIVAGMDDNVGIVQGMIQSFYDAPGGFKEEMEEIMIGTGIEYTYARQFMMRAGYYYDHKSVNRKYFTIGAGMRYQMFTLDIAYLIPTAQGFSNPLANTIRMSLSIDFGHVSRTRTQTTVPQSYSGFFNY